MIEFSFGKQMHLIPETLRTASVIIVCHYIKTVVYHLNGIQIGNIMRNIGHDYFRKLLFCHIMCNII